MKFHILSILLQVDEKRSAPGQVVSSQNNVHYVYLNKNHCSLSLQNLRRRSDGVKGISRDHPYPPCWALNLYTCPYVPLYTQRICLPPQVQLGPKITLLVWNEHVPGGRGKDQQILNLYCMQSPMPATWVASRDCFWRN